MIKSHKSVPKSSLPDFAWKQELLVGVSALFLSEFAGLSLSCHPSRPDSADGCLSPTRSSSRNGEKDWENGSTTSSLTSNTEYTG